MEVRMIKYIIKFGGTILNKNNSLNKITDILKKYDNNYIIVVSAIEGITDRLENVVREIKNHRLNFEKIDYIIKFLKNTHINILKQYNKLDNDYNILNSIDEELLSLTKLLKGSIYINDITDFLEDEILSYGEKLSCLIYTYLLKKRDIKINQLFPENAGILTDGTYKKAMVKLKQTEENLRKTIKKNQNYIIPGFYGISKSKKITIFGRNGSDYTAGILGYCLNVKFVDLWKSVDGFMSSNPKYVTNAISLKYLSYFEAAELSYFGADILHSNTIDPLYKKSIPLRIFNFNSKVDLNKPNTVIQSKQNSNIILKSITFKNDIGVLKFIGSDVGKKPGIIANISSLLSKKNINIKSIFTSQTTINFLLSKNNLNKALNIFENKDLAGIESIDYLKDVSLIAVIGDGIDKKEGVISKILNLVSKKGVNIEIISGGASRSAFYFIIKQEELFKILDPIHNFILKEYKREVVNV